MSEQAVRFLTNLLGIYSPSGKEEDIATFLAEEMKKMGFEVGKDAIGNVIGVVGEGEPVILLCGASIQGIAVVAGALFALSIHYHLFLSPLNKFPGRKLAALTRYYEFYYDFFRKGRYEWEIKDMHKQYGDCCSFLNCACMHLLPSKVP